MTLFDLFITPFADYLFMKKALVAALALAASGTPLGVFMMLRRMTLVGDALSHALLPGIAMAFFIAGTSLWAMTAGGLLAALALASLAVFLSRYSQMKEDAAFALVYLVALAGGVCLIAMKGSSVDLMHILFGNILAVDNPTLWLVIAVASATLLIVAGLYRRLVIDGFDHDFLRTAGTLRVGAGLTRLAFFALLMLNLVAAFQALGTLMALGLMILPALAARFWARTIDAMIPLAIVLAMISAYGGLVLSYHVQIPSGPAIVLLAGGCALLSAVVGRVGSVLATIK